MAPIAAFTLLFLGLALTSAQEATLGISGGDTLDRGALIKTLEDGTEIYERMFVKKATYRWVKEATFSNKDPDELVFELNESEDEQIDQETFVNSMLDMSDEELVSYDRNIMLFAGQEFHEEIPDPAARAAQVRKRLLNSLISTNEDTEVVSVPRDGKERNFTHPPSADFADNDTYGASSHPPGRKLLQSCGDSRSVVNNQAWPHTSQVVLGQAYSSTSNSLSWNSCSATLVHDSTALSAAHCFWDVNSASWSSQYSWAPGYDQFDSDPSPNGMWKSCYGVTIKSAYTQQSSYSYTAQKWDYAVMTFHQCTEPVRNGIDPSTPGATLSLAGYWPNAPGSALSTMYNRGYPGSSQTCPGNQYCSIRVWGDSGSYSDLTTDFVHSYAVTISKGHSGSGTYAYYSANDQPYVVCVTIAGYICSGKDNSYMVRCHRITDDFDQLIQDVSNDY